MKKVLWSGLPFSVILMISVMAANAFTLTGTVNDNSGKAVQGADILLIQKGLKTKTDASGAFTIHQDEEMQAIANRIDVGYLSVNNGILSFSQGANTPVQVQIFDMVGNSYFKDNYKKKQLFISRIHHRFD